MVILRPCGIHGPRRRATVDFSSTDCAGSGSGSTVLRADRPPDFHINDVVSSIMSALEQPQLRGEIQYRWCRSVEFPRLVSLVADRLGTRVRHIKAPTALTGSLALATTTAWRRVGSPPEILERLASPVINRSVDISGGLPRSRLRAISAGAWHRRDHRGARQERLLRIAASMELR